MSEFIAYRNLDDTEGGKCQAVYGVGMRFWHWSNVVLMIVLCPTGYLIGMPLTAQTGDTSELYSMGWIRFFHLAGGYLFTILAFYRLWIVFAERQVSHQVFIPAIWRKDWMAGLKAQLGWLCALRDQPLRYVGLNPVNVLLGLFGYLLPGLVVIVTGLAMYAEVTGHESWQYYFFGWLTGWFGNTLDLHVIHRLAMWEMVIFILFHVVIVLREDVLTSQNVVSKMLSGVQQYRE